MPRKTFLITAGPTQEPIDPVRFLTNRSSGKMGYALAEAAKKMGHRVILISGPTALEKPAGMQLISVQTAREMYQAVMDHYKKADVILKVAAVADYHPERVARHKIKKSRGNLTITLVKNPDILTELGKKKQPHQILVGFAAETKNRYRNAHRKLKEKNCDWIILNDVSQKGMGFLADQNQVTLFSRWGHVKHINKTSKTNLASKILKIILE